MKDKIVLLQFQLNELKNTPLENKKIGVVFSQRNNFLINWYLNTVNENKLNELEANEFIDVLLRALDLFMKFFIDDKTGAFKRPSLLTYFKLGSELVKLVGDLIKYIRS